jgi:hypothetical protein
MPSEASNGAPRATTRDTSKSEKLSTPGRTVSPRHRRKKTRGKIGKWKNMIAKMDLTNLIDCYEKWM